VDLSAVTVDDEVGFTADELIAGPLDDDAFIPIARRPDLAD
jgi:hypothetical protein